VTAAENLKHFIGNAEEKEMTAEEMSALEEVKAFVQKFEEAMDDDFNTADAISAVFELVKYANTHAAAENAKAYLESIRKTLTDLCDILGVIVEKEEELLDEEIENLIAERNAARKAKDFARADEIRNELLEKGIILKDTREGVQWKRA
jgi:cysteinyl-tRNA synthetase